MDDNVFYFKRINNIGGTENFLWEIAKEYRGQNITVLYDYCDDFQLRRLRKLVRCKRRIKGEKIVCKRAFFNYNIEAINDIESTENYYAFVCHTIYQHIKLTPPLRHPKLNHFIAVSEYAKEMLEDYAKEMGLDIKVERCYNPISCEPVDKVLHLMSACRLNDQWKGGDRTVKLVNALDRYCAENNRHYTFDIYSNGTGDKVINSPNVNIKPGRIDIRPFIADADVVVTLSNDVESYCYTNIEALCYGKRLLTTPLTVLKELNIPADVNYILDWDMSNIDEVIDKMFTDLYRGYKKYNYTAPKDCWDKFLYTSTSDYAPKNITVIALTNYYDLDLKCKIKRGDKLKMIDFRANELIEKGIVLPIEE